MIDRRSVWHGLRPVALGGALLGLLCAPASADAALAAFQAFFEKGCVAAKMKDKSANVAGLTRLDRKSERDWLDREQGQVWVRDAADPAPSPRLVVVTRGQMGCRVSARGISERALHGYLTRWDQRSAEFSEEKEMAEKDAETSIRVFGGESRTGVPLIIFAVSVPFLKSATVTVARVEDVF